MAAGVTDNDFRQLVERHPRAIMVTSSEPRILYVNHAFTEVTGYGESQVLGSKPSILSSGHHNASFYSHMWKALMQTDRWEGLVWNQRADGELYPQWLMIYGLEIDSKQHYIGSFMDVGDFSALDEKLTSFAYYDMLTQLPNRHLFQAFLESRVSQQKNRGDLFSVLFIDLDFFKEINDLHGHAQGDRLLRYTADKIRHLLRKLDTVARLSGDEFAAIVEVGDQEELEQLCQRITDEFKQPIHINQQTHFIGVSIGAAIFPTHSEKADKLLELADQAMYSAKNAGRGCFRVFDESINAAVLRNEHIAQALLQSLNQSPEEFTVLYQPHFMIATGELSGLEALMRWHHPHLGEVSPNEFIAVAETRGWMGLVTQRLVDLIVRDLRKPAQSLPMGVRLAINASASHVISDEFMHMASRLQQLVSLYNWELEIEITETSMIELSHKLTQRLTLLQNQGIRIAIDDFGTGYSSLSYLQSLPVNVLKVDRTFVNHLSEPQTTRKLVRAILAMAHALNLEVVAEGIETKQQLQLLQQMNCKHGQGFGLAMPQPWCQSLFNSLDPDQLPLC